jgi:hypothetical protein
VAGLLAGLHMPIASAQQSELEPNDTGAQSNRATPGISIAVVAGQNYTLRPEYLVVDQPVGHATDSYWSENGTLYLRNFDLSAQGFKAQ